MKQFVRTGRPPNYPKGTHGNMSEYERGCRCEACRAAASTYQRERRQRLKCSRGDFFVSAELAREHLVDLQRAHVGIRAVAAVTGILFPRVREIRNGTVTRIRQSTEEKILRVTEDARSDSSYVDAAETNRLVDQLLALGHTQGELARRMGYKVSHSGLQFYHKARVTARTAMRLEKLYRQILREREQRVDKMLELVRRVAA
jgi:hypothetical protein